MSVEEADWDRVNELTKRKKKLIAKIRRASKTQAKARVEKRKINDAIKALRGKRSPISGMTPEQAAVAVKSSIESVVPSDMFPEDLEREFDKVDRKSKSVPQKVLNLGRIPEQPISVGSPSEDDDGFVHVEAQPHGDDYGVIDLSEQSDQGGQSGQSDQGNQSDQ